MEIWKTIKEFEEYQVSNLGRIKSFKCGKERILKPNIQNQYYAVNLFKNKKLNNFNIHKLVAINFLNHTPCGMKLVINHINFNKLDNRVCNLEIVTHRENSNQKHLKSSSQYTGVSWDKKSNKWKSSICINNKPKILGTFNNEKEASLYYENALISLKNNEKILVKKYIPKGYSYHKHMKKWYFRINNAKIKYHSPYFKTELEVITAYNLFLTSKRTRLHRIPI